jgi:predicted DCC family thiol-disulfide oxidoreductase YuxK
VDGRASVPRRLGFQASSPSRALRESTAALLTASTRSEVDVATTRSPIQAQEFDSQTKRSVLLFDQRCGVCRRFVNMVVNADRDDRLRIAPLDSVLGDAIRRRYPSFAGRDSALLVRPDGSIASYSDAIVHVLMSLRGPWRALGWLVGHTPRRLRDAAYTAIAGHRNLFARFGAAELVPSARAREFAVATPGSQRHD